MIKQVQLKIDQGSWSGSKKVFPFSTTGKTASIDYLMALLWIGVASVPVNIPGWPASIQWAQLRYFCTANNATQLRLRPEANEVDSHHKTVMSDDWGVGFALQWLMQHFAYPDVAHGATAMKYLVELGVAGYVGRKKRGPAKCPDFLAVDPSGKIHIIECKGTQSVGYSAAHLIKGTPQKNNVKFVNENLVAQRLVSGLFIAGAKTNKQSALTIVDPPADDRRGYYLVRADDAVPLRRAIKAATLANASWQSGILSRLNEDVESATSFEARGRSWVGVRQRLEFNGSVKLSNGAQVIGCEVRHGIDPALASRVRMETRAVDLVQDLDLQTIQERGVSEPDAQQTSPFGSQGSDNFSLYACIRHGTSLISDWKIFIK